MTSERYFSELAAQLSRLPAQEREEALRFHREYAQEAGFTTYQELEACFGTPKALASRLYAESAVKASEEKGPGKPGKALIIGLAALFSLPVTFPLVLVILIVLFVVLVLILAVGFSIGVTVFALGGAFISLAAESWGYLLSFAPGLWLKFLGGAMIVLAVIIIIIFLILFAARHILRWIGAGIARIAERRTKDE